jgi:glutamate carboxypeptidase
VFGHLFAGESTALAESGSFTSPLTRSETEMCEIIASREDRMMSTLEEWVNINTGSWNVEGKRILAQKITEKLVRLGFRVDVREVDTRRWPTQTQELLGPLIIGRRAAGSVSVFKPARFLLVGHYDTVFEPDSEFKRLTMKDEARRIATGPGVADMKGGIVIMLEALSALDSQGLLDLAEWTVVMNPDEEISSPASGDWIRGYSRVSDYGFVFEMAHGSGAMVRSRRGIGQYFMSIQGVAAHMGSAAAKGASAVLEMAHKIIQAESTSDEMKGVSVRAGIVGGGEKINIVPERADAWFDIRFERPEDGYRTLKKLDEITGVASVPHTSAYGIGRLVRPPKIASKRSDRLLQAHADVARDIGLELPDPIVLAGGGTDGSLMQDEGLPTLDSMGVVGGDAHTDREFADMNTLKERAAVCAVLLKRLMLQAGQARQN